MKPIEPGCLVVITNAKSDFLIGMHGKAIKRSYNEIYSLTARKMTRAAGRWFVDTASGYKACIPEKWLLRIDDYDASQDETEQDKELTT